MKAFYCDQFVLPLPPSHRFPMAKYRLLRERVVDSGIVTIHANTVREAARWCTAAGATAAVS